MVRVNIAADIPDDLLQEFLQHLRDFDVRYSDRCHLMISAKGETSLDKMNRILDEITPPFAQRWTGNKQ